jgi:CRISPR-associated endonuclease Cas3-HD
MSEAYAYLYGDRKQTLREHIYSCLEALDKIKSSKIWNLVKKLCGSSAERYIKIAVIFHDSGKILYQKNFKTKNDVKYLSFYGHEIYSTYFISEFLNAKRRAIENVKQLDVLRLFKLAVIASVLYHHHAMGVRYRIKRLSKISYENVFVKEFDKLIEDLLENPIFLSDILKNKSEGHLSPNNVSNVVSDLNREIWIEFVKSKKFRKTMLLFTNILLIADYMGSQDRDGTKTEFAKVLDEFLELYSTSTHPAP